MTGGARKEPARRGAAAPAPPPPFASKAEKIYGRLNAESDEAAALARVAHIAARAVYALGGMMTWRELTNRLVDDYWADAGSVAIAEAVEAAMPDDECMDDIIGGEW